MFLLVVDALGVLDIPLTFLDRLLVGEILVCKLVLFGGE